MRSIARIAALILVLLALVVPLTTFASDGPCPDDPEGTRNCNREVPPYYVVINRSEEHLMDRPGSGCQPWILKHPDCIDCVSGACGTIDVEAEVCLPMLSKRVTVNGFDPIIYELCCDCTTPDGEWLFRVREWRSDGTCPITQPDPDFENEWLDGLPPGTGIDLPAPLIVGGLSVLGVGLLASGLLIRRRSLRSA
jgi:hypothetical protein